MASNRRVPVEIWCGQDVEARGWWEHGTETGEPRAVWRMLPPDESGLGTRTAGLGPEKPAPRPPWGLSMLVRWEAPRVARFAAVYQVLRALPRRVRRALQRQLALSLAEVALLLALGQGPAWAATINVTGGCTLVNAITSANSHTSVGGCTQGSGDDTIVLSAASTFSYTSSDNSTYGPNALPVVTSAITIVGKGSTIQRTSGTLRLLSVGTAGNLTLRDLTLTGGSPGSTQSGGALYSKGSLTIINSTISSSTAGFGGGIGNSAGAALTLIHTTVSGNSVTGSGPQAGGVDNYGGTAILANSTIANNSAAGIGGGIGNRNNGPNTARLTVASSTISGNTGTQGGGMYNSGGTATITNSTISGNAATGNGGGLVNNGTLTVTNSTISGNTAGGYGGGVSSSASTTLTNCTITSNASGSPTGAVDCNICSMTLVQTLVSGNTTTSGGPQVYNFSGTMNVNNYNIFGQDNTAGITGFSVGTNDIIPSGALASFLDTTLAFNGGPTKTHNLVSGGAAVNQVAACAQDTDQRGFVRPSGATCDVGAVEFGAAEPSVVNSQVTFALLSSTLSTITDTTGCGSGYAGKLSFQARLTNTTGSPSLADLKQQVASLTNNNKLLTADGGLAGVGALQTMPQSGQFSDGVLSATETLDVPLVICLKTMDTFQLFVDVLGLTP